MRRAPRICNENGCAALVYGKDRRCSKHYVPWANTGSTINRSDTKARKTLRHKVFERDGHMCQLRYKDICVGLGNQLDRIDNLKGYSPDNCQCACVPCHRRKSSYEGHAARGHNTQRGTHL